MFSFLLRKVKVGSVFFECFGAVEKSSLVDYFDYNCSVEMADLQSCRRRKWQWKYLYLHSTMTVGKYLWIFNLFIDVHVSKSLFIMFAFVKISHELVSRRQNYETAVTFLHYKRFYRVINLTAFLWLLFTYQLPNEKFKRNHKELESLPGQFTWSHAH